MFRGVRFASQSDRSETHRRPLRTAECKLEIVAVFFNKKKQEVKVIAWTKASQDRCPGNRLRKKVK